MVTYCYVTMDMKSTSRFLDTDTCRLSVMWEVPTHVMSHYYMIYFRVWFLNMELVHIISIHMENYSEDVP
jgi:hypothetical protein